MIFTFLLSSEILVHVARSHVLLRKAQAFLRSHSSSPSAKVSSQSLESCSDPWPCPFVLGDKTRYDFDNRALGHVTAPPEPLPGSCVCGLWGDSRRPMRVAFGHNDVYFKGALCHRAGGLFMEHGHPRAQPPRPVVTPFL